MTASIARGLLLPTALAILGLLCGCLSFLPARVRSMTIRPVTHWAFKPHPVGRFLLDLPVGAEFAQWHQTYGASGPICVEPEVSQEEYEEAVKRRVDQLQATKHTKGGTLLIKQIPFASTPGRTLLYFKDRFYDTDPLKADTYAWHEGFLYQFTTRTYLDPEVQKSDTDWFQKICRAMRPLQPGEIPTEHGYCFEHSILADQPKLGRPESIIATALWLEGHPDVLITFSTYTNYKDLDPPLLSRVEKPGLFSGIKVLRSGRRDLASGEPGEEHLERIQERIGATGHLFVWEAQGRTGFDDDHPQIRLEMSTGNGRQGPENSSLREQDALILWDHLVDSVRLRPVVRPGQS
jgi:hypothetical protein